MREIIYTSVTLDFQTRAIDLTGQLVDVTTTVNVVSAEAGSAAIITVVQTQLGLIHERTLVTSADWAGLLTTVESQGRLQGVITTLASRYEAGFALGEEDRKRKKDKEPRG